MTTETVSKLSLEEFSRLVNELAPSEQVNHRDLYLSLRDPISFIDELIRLRYEVEQGATTINHAHDNPLQPAGSQVNLTVADSGVSASLSEDQFPALPSELTLHIEPGHAAIHGHHVIRWVNSETAEVAHMSRAHFSGGGEKPLVIDTGPLGGETGAWHLEIYQASDSLSRIGRIPITVGPNQQATRRTYRH